MWAENLDDSVSSLIDALALTTDAPDVIDCVAGAMNVNRRGSLSHHYYEEEGVRRSFKKALHALDDWLKSWLSETYFIAKEGILEPGAIRYWSELPSDERFVKIVNYVFDIRNVYTHTVEYRPTREDNWGTLGLTIEGTKYRFQAIRDDGGDPVFDVGIREGFAETDILNLLVIAYVRKKWLCLHDDESFLHTYWEITDYRRARYNFLRELRWNLDLVENWCSMHLLRLCFEE